MLKYSLNFLSGKKRGGWGQELAEHLPPILKSGTLLLLVFGCALAAQRLYQISQIISKEKNHLLQLTNFAEGKTFPDRKIGYQDLRELQSRALSRRNWSDILDTLQSTLPPRTYLKEFIFDQGNVVCRGESVLDARTEPLSLQKEILGRINQNPVLSRPFTEWSLQEVQTSDGSQKMHFTLITRIPKK